MNYFKITRFNICKYQTMCDKRNMMTLPVDIIAEFLLGSHIKVIKARKQENFERIEAYLANRDYVRFERIGHSDIILIELSLKDDMTKKSYLTANIYPSDEEFDVLEIFLYYTDESKDLDFQSEVIKKSIINLFKS